MKNLLRSVSLIIVITMTVGVCACTSISSDISSNFLDEVLSDYDKVYENTEIDQTSQETNNPVNSVTQPTSNYTTGNQSTYKNNNESNNNSATTQSSSNNFFVEENDPNKSKEPNVTICARVASNIYIVGGSCSSDTEYILVGGVGVTQTKITPTKGQSEYYFIGQVSTGSNTTLEIQGKEKNKNLSTAVKRFVTVSASQKNLMTSNAYAPVFCRDSRMHYYSSILSYTLSNAVNIGIKNAANYYIGETVNAAKNVGAEVIYLVVPSSAAVYPETLPDEYRAATGESLYKAFSNVASSKGATVIYPLDIMKAHKNDGDGYKIYSHTDSHWTTYGAYFGVSELMNYISGKYPSARPRSVSEMGFYTTELYGGDSLFSFGDNSGFENYSQAYANGGATRITGIKELTTLYTLKMPTDTLSRITRNKKSIYLTRDNEGKYDFTNNSSVGLPSAVVVRDSFGRTAYDMINDRFSEVHWLAEGDYTSVTDEIYSKLPNYVIYIVSERNLLKVMLNNKDIELTNF